MIKIEDSILFLFDLELIRMKRSFFFISVISEQIIDYTQTDLEY